MYFRYTGGGDCYLGEGGWAAEYNQMYFRYTDSGNSFLGEGGRKIIFLFTDGWGTLPERGFMI